VTAVDDLNDFLTAENLRRQRTNTIPNFMICPYPLLIAAFIELQAGGGLPNIPTNSLLGRDSPGVGPPENILLNATLEMDGAGNLQVADFSIDDTKLAFIANNVILGRGPGGIGPVQQIPPDTSIVMNGINIAVDPIFVLNLIGAFVDASLNYAGAPTFVFSRAALTGDVTAPLGSNTLTIPVDTITFAKMLNATAASKLVGRGSAAGAGDFEEITLGTNLSMTGTTLNAASGAAGDIDYPETGALTVNTGKYHLTGGRHVATGSQRITVTGTGRLRIQN
jgi:hypothetical protein